MDVVEELKRGLIGSKKFVPFWYKFDETGCNYYNENIQHNEYYYLHKSEKQLISENVLDLMNTVTQPFLLADLGCGTAEKTKYFIDEYLTKESTLTYMPVDICRDSVETTSRTLSETYAKRLTIDGIVGDYHTVIPKVLNYPGQKLIVWLSGLFNLPYSEQIALLSLTSQRLNDNDRLLVTFDITQEKETIENAYIDPSGFLAKVNLNVLHRLNKEMGANFDVSQYKYEDGLNMKVEFEKGEKLQLSEEGGTSYKYTENQLNILFERSNLKIVKLWKNKHCAMVLLKTS
ncbi:histidine N-alpha-methyltransferase-like isoform X3 [Mytilus galloprovincialis]|uniref:histidine N-alpha-methyltransferase-like isoform X3 n=1 Tax=Mytilus galloprovincialis TaxID=29158 RepID=UPI003F7BCEEE